MTTTTPAVDVWALIVEPDYTVTRVTEEVDGLDLARARLGRADGPALDIVTLGDRDHVAAVGGFSAYDDPPNPLAWLCYGRDMLHGTVVLWHDPDDDYETDEITPVPVDPRFVAFVEGAATLLRSGRDAEDVADLIRKQGPDAVPLAAGFISAGLDDRLADKTADELEALDERAQLEALFDESWCDPMHPDFDPDHPFWTTMPTEVRLSFLQARQRLAVMQHGYTKQGVFAVEEGQHAFCYTIGLDPAIIAVGFSQDEYGLLDFAVEAAREHADGDPFTFGDGRLVFAPVPDDEFRSHCRMAVAEGATSARQIIWQDDELRWPWEPGHRHQTEGTLPVLAGPDWRPNP